MREGKKKHAIRRSSARMRGGVCVCVCVWWMQKYKKLCAKHTETVRGRQRRTVNANHRRSLHAASSARCPRSSETPTWRAFRNSLVELICLLVILTIVPTLLLLLLCLFLTLNLSPFVFPPSLVLSVPSVLWPAVARCSITGAHRRERGSIIKGALLCWSDHIEPPPGPLCTTCTRWTDSLLYALTYSHIL